MKISRRSFSIAVAGLLALGCSQKPEPKKSVKKVFHLVGIDDTLPQLRLVGYDVASRAYYTVADKDIVAGSRCAIWFREGENAVCRLVDCEFVLRRGDVAIIDEGLTKVVGVNNFIYYPIGEI